MDDAPAEVEVGGQRFAGQVISVQGSEVAVGIEHDFGKSIAEARLITNLWYLLEALRKRFEEVLSGQRAMDTRLGQRLFGFSPVATHADAGDLNLPPSPCVLNDEQLAAIRAACGSDVHFIWGPPGTGKTQTIGFLIAALLRRNLRVLAVSHTNVATDHAIGSAATPGLTLALGVPCKPTSIVRNVDRQKCWFVVLTPSFWAAWTIRSANVSRSSFDVANAS